MEIIAIMAKALLGKIVRYTPLGNSLQALIKCRLIKFYIPEQYAKSVALMHTAAELTVVATGLKNVKIPMLKLSYI